MCANIKHLNSSIQQENEDNIAVRSAPESGSSVPPSVPSRQGEMIASRPAVSLKLQVYRSQGKNLSNSNQCKYINNSITPMLQGGDVEIQLKKSVEKIQELNAEVSAARQDNLQLKVRLISQLHRKLL